MKQKAILAGVNIIGSNQNIDEEMNELRALCEACDIEVVDIVIQNLTRINPTTYLGTGKLEEIKPIIDYYDSSIIVFNDELSPSQIRTIEKAL